jgi:hypothetical protein
MLVFCYTLTRGSRKRRNLFQSDLGTVVLQNQTGVTILLLAYIDRLNAEYKGIDEGHKLGA